MYKVQLHIISFQFSPLEHLVKKLNTIFSIKYFLLKNKKNTITLLKSPHVHKKARIQYKQFFFKYLIIFKHENFNMILYFLKNFQKFNLLNIKYKIKIIK